MIPGWIVISLLGIGWYFWKPDKEQDEKKKRDRGYEMTLEEKEELIK